MENYVLKPKNSANMRKGRNKPAIKLSFSRKCLIVPYSVAFVITVAVGLISVAPSLNYVFQCCKNFWLVAGEYRQDLWNRFLDNVGDDPVDLWTYGKFFRLPFFTFYFLLMFKAILKVQWRLLLSCIGLSEEFILCWILQTNQQL